MDICNICFDKINNDIYRCKLNCNSFYHFECAKNWAYKVNTCPFCRSSNFYELPNFEKFYEYCKKCNLDEIKKLNLNLDDIRSEDNSALRLASSNGNIEVVKYIINKGLTLEDIRSYDNEAFRWACTNGHLEVIKYLIDKGLTIDDIRSIDNQAFRYASKNGYLEVVKYLVNQGLTLEDIRSKDNYVFLRTRLNGHFEVIKFIEETLEDLEDLNFNLILTVSLF